MDVLLFIFKETSAGKKSIKNIPVVEKVGVEASQVDDLLRKGSSPHCAPILYLFFSDQSEFQLAAVAVDNSIIHLQAADVVKAIIGFIAVFFVFHVGYASPHGAFLGFIQEVYLGIPYTSKKTISLSQFCHLYEDNLKKHRQLKSFKKFSIDA